MLDCDGRHPTPHCLILWLSKCVCVCVVVAVCVKAEQVKITDVINHKRCATPEADPIVKAAEQALQAGNTALAQARKHMATPKKPKAKAAPGP